MRSFYTEKETEEWLQTEMRELPLPGGGTRPLTGFHLLWVVYDELVEKGYSPERLVGWAIEETELTGVCFERAFPGVVAYVDKHCRKAKP